MSKKLKESSCHPSIRSMINEWDYWDHDVFMKNLLFLIARILKLRGTTPYGGVRRNEISEEA